MILVSLFVQSYKSQITTFNYTGGSQNYVVPAGVTVICFTVSGAQGMRNAQGSNLGGLGGRVTGSMPVTPGQVLQINVGGGGLISSAGGFNGGGNGGIITTNCCPTSHAGGGGGASDIRIAPYGLANRVAVGGGGGGTGGNRVVGCAPGTGGGGGGGYFGGGGGGAYGGSPGAGGSQVAGGAGGASCCGCPLAPQPGAAGAAGQGGQGGNLGGCNNQAANNPGCAGGIGGALTGGIGPNCTGGTGCPSTWAGASGGGGSNFAGGAVIGPAHFAGVQAGHGQVIIQPNCCQTPTIVPVANPNPICAGKTATLTATGAGIGGTYTWTPGPINGSLVTVSPSVTTIYTVSGSNTLNCVGTQTIQLTVNPLPTVTPGSNSPVCSGGTINLTVNAASTYTWSGPNLFSSSLQNPNIINATTAMSGNYTVSVTNASGCTNSAVTNVTVNPTPTISPGNTGPYCAGATINLTVAANASYTWTGPSAFLNNNQNPTIANSSTVNGGVYTVTVTTTGGCNSTGTTNVIVNPAPTPTANSNSPVCLGSPLNLTGLGGTTYTWTGPNNYTSTLQNPSIPTASLANAGNYTLSVTNTNGCTNSVVINVVINGLPTITVTNPTVCLNSPFSLTASGGTAYAWSGPNAYNSNLQNPFFAAASNSLAGSYTVLVTSAQGCTNTSIANVSVVPLPTVSVAGTNTFCSQNFNGSPNSVILTASGAGSFNWTLPAGFNATPNLNSNIITVTGPLTAVQTVASMSVIGTSGTCTNSAVYSLTVMPNPTLTVLSGSMCAGFNVALSASGASTYTWSPGASLNTTFGPTVIANPSQTTVYNVIGSDAGCNSQSQTGTATVVVNPTVTIAPNSPTVCYGSTINLTAVGATNYTWTPNIAINTLNGPNVSVNPLTNQTYSVIGEQSTCTHVAVTTVTVISLPVVLVNTSAAYICMNNFNGSPNSVTLTASGANSYQWVGLSGLTPNNTSGSSIIAASIPPSVIGTGSVIGSVGTCSSMSTFSIPIMVNPIISATSNTMCFNSSAMISASGATNYFWSPANNLNTTTGSSVIANPIVTTVYSVFGSSLNCNSQSQTSTVTVIPNPSLTISPLNATICAGSTLPMMAAGATSYTWSPSASLDNSNTANVNATPNITTVYTVIGELNGCTSSTTRQVTVVPLPTLMAEANPPAICAGDKTTINANGAYTYTWSPIYGLSNPYSNQTIANPTITTVYTLIGNNGACTASLSVPVVVLPKPVMSLTSTNPKICKGSNTTIFASGAQNYIWSPQNGLNMLSSSAAIASPSVSTNYTIIGVNSSGSVSCVMTQEVFVQVVPNATASTSGSVSICRGESVRISAYGGDTYVWYPSTGLSNNLVPFPYASPSITTVYSANVSNGGMCSSVAQVTVNVHPYPEVNAGPDQTINLDEPMYLNATGTGTLTWVFGEGILCKDCPYTQIMPKNSSCYRIEAVNQFGCKATDEVCVEVTKDFNVYIPNVFTPNYDGINDEFMVYGTGIEEIEMIIFDRWGERLYTSKEQLKGWDGTFKGEMSKNDAYVYLINFKTIDGKKHTRTGHVTLMK